MRTPGALVRRLGVSGVVAATVAALSMVTGAQSRPRFYPDDPLWQEPITPVTNARRYEPSLFFDTIENVFAHPGDRVLDQRAKNVNSVDEVMDGPWFTNRAGRIPLTPADVARAANTGTGPADGPWTIVSAKSDGVTPGFTVRDRRGDLWFLKFDPPGHRAMASGSEIVSAKLFWAAGYHTVEYYITSLKPADLVIGDSAKYTPPGARARRMSLEDVRKLLERAEVDPDGSYRVIASKAAPGAPIGRIIFHGTRSDDPNDLVAHEHHRELRGYRVFAAWLNHVDAKSINSIDVLVKDGGRQYIRHYLLDFGSTLGSGSVAPREYFEGYEPVVEPYGEVGRRMIALGFRIPAWRTVPAYSAPSIGRIPLDHENWDPDLWTPRFPNAAFRHAREDDKFWAARKLQSISDEMIAAAVAEGKFGDAAAEAKLVRFLTDRRQAILRRYLPAINPVVDPAIDANGTLSFANAAVEAGVAGAPGEYLVTWSVFDNAAGTARDVGETKGGTRQPAPAALSVAEGGYVRVAISAGAGGQPSWSKPIHAYFTRGSGGWILAGLERLPHRP